jgi:hypothetical protein
VIFWVLIEQMRCIFPQAVKPWQKALCGVVGVGLLGTGLVLGFHAMRKVSHEVLGSTIFIIFVDGHKCA